MNILFCIFLILASLVCLATLTWVTRDIVLDVIERKKKPTETPTAVAEEETAEETLSETLEENALIPETIVTSIIVEQDTAVVDVVDIVWEEHIGKNKTYRYAPNEFEIGKGDIVLVPTFSSSKHGEIARKATVGSDVYTIDPAELQFKLKPVLRVMQKATPAADVAETPAE